MTKTSYLVRIIINFNLIYIYYHFICAAEMGSDFNILEYADPELDLLQGGEKTNILDSLDLVEPEPVKEEKKDNKTT